MARTGSMKVYNDPTRSGPATVVGALSDAFQFSKDAARQAADGDCGVALDSLLSGFSRMEDGRQAMGLNTYLHLADHGGWASDALAEFRKADRTFRDVCLRRKS